MTSCLGIDVGIRNLSFCILKKEDKLYTIGHWALVDVLECCGMQDASCKDLTSGQIHTIAHFVIPAIFPAKFIKENKIAHVSIEQQPHGKYGNQKIILFSHLLYDYFRCLIWAVKWGDVIQTVNFTGAGQKYQKTWLSRYNLSTSRNYGQRKQNSITLCEKLRQDLNVQGNAEVWIENTDKQDDLADAFLLALAIWDRWS
jgi:hypothetical protein